MYVGPIAHHEQRALGQQAQERHAVGIESREFGHDVHLLPPFSRQLVLHLKGADGVDVVAEEVDTIRIFASVGVDIEDAATQGKLAGLIDIVHTLKLQFTQQDHHLRHVYRLPHRQVQAPIVQLLLVDHQFGQCLRVGHHIEQGTLGQTGNAGKHLGTQYLAGCIALPIFYRAAIARRKEEHLLLPHGLCQVVVEIACLVGILQDKHHRAAHPLRDRSKQERRGRARQPLQVDAAHRLIVHQPYQCARLRTRTV